MSSRSILINSGHKNSVIFRRYLSPLTVTVSPAASEGNLNSNVIHHFLDVKIPWIFYLFKKKRYLEHIFHIAHETSSSLSGWHKRVIRLWFVHIFLQSSISLGVLNAEWKLRWSLLVSKGHAKVLISDTTSFSYSGSVPATLFQVYLHRDRNSV